MNGPNTPIGAPTNTTPEINLPDVVIKIIKRFDHRLDKIDKTLSEILEASKVTDDGGTTTKLDEILSELKRSRQSSTAQIKSLADMLKD